MDSRLRGNDRKKGILIMGSGDAGLFGITILFLLFAGIIFIGLIVSVFTISGNIKRIYRLLLKETNKPKA